MKRHMRKVVQAALAVCVTVGLMPAPAFAGEQIAAGSSPELATQVAGTVLADTDNAWKHDYALWSSPQTSYLHVNAAGKLERVGLPYQSGMKLRMRDVFTKKVTYSGRDTVPYNIPPHTCQAYRCTPVPA